MHIPSLQTLLTAGAAMTSVAKSGVVSKGKILDFAVEKCVDADGKQRCTTPFAVTKGSCYNFEWSTEGALSHTTVEVKDAGSSEMIYYRDTNGEWTSEKNELVYLDFKPKVPNTGNSTVTYKVAHCEKKEDDSL